jgi:hypothetical protein
MAKHARRPTAHLLRLRPAGSYQPGLMRLRDVPAVAVVAQHLRERAGAMNLPKISTALTASQLRARVLAVLASMNGKAPKT